MGAFVWAAALVFAADRLTKFLAFNFLAPDAGVEILPGVFRLTLVRNTGVAFGMFKNAGLSWAALSLASAGAIFLYLWRGRPQPAGRRWAWALIAGGALGNAYDRIRFGAVIDFLDFRVWPVFNFADAAIVTGAAALAALAFFTPASR